MKTNQTLYYVTNYANGLIFAFDENWNNLFNKSSFASAVYIAVRDDILYISGQANIWKTDKDLNVLIQYNTVGTPYYGIYYNSSNDFIYSAAVYSYAIQIFDSNLTLNYSITTLSYYPWSIVVNNNQMFVGVMFSGIILVISDNQIINQFNGCSGNSVTVYGLIIDEINNIAAGCSDNQMYLNSINGTYKNAIPLAMQPRYFSFDSNSKILIVTDTEIDIYN